MPDSVGAVKILSWGANLNGLQYRDAGEIGTLADGVKAEARRLGFELAGIAPAVTPTGLHEFLDWLERGHAGEMHYFERREEAYGHPRHVLDGVRSVVMLGINYNTQAPQRHEERRREETSSAEADTGAAIAVAPAIKARIARYAQGSVDYHDVIRGKLRELARFLSREAPGCKVRGVVDTAPLLERDFARAAGLGWFGKNTMLINKHLGSWFFLAALLVDVELEYDAPHAESHCGTCTRCLDACPTGAFVEPYVLDARRCISYFTIEHRGQSQKAASSRHGRLALRLRHLSGSLPVEPKGAPFERTGLRTAARIERCRCGGALVARRG